MVAVRSHHTSPRRKRARDVDQDLAAAAADEHGRPAKRAAVEGGEGRDEPMNDNKLKLRRVPAPPRIPCVTTIQAYLPVTYGTVCFVVLESHAPCRRAVVTRVELLA